MQVMDNHIICTITILEKQKSDWFAGAKNPTSFEERL
jgi:hypothetical protein